MSTPNAPSRILPDLQCALLCEDIRVELNQNYILIGVLNNLVVRQVPFPIGRMLLFTRWTAGFGEFIQTSRLIAPDKTTVLGQCEVQFALRTGEDIGSTVSVFQQIQIPEAGTYFLEVAVDQVSKIKFPLRVSVAPPPDQAAAQKTPG
jgi:hypothetical protein